MAWIKCGNKGEAQEGRATILPPSKKVPYFQVLGEPWPLKGMPSKGFPLRIKLTRNEALRLIADLAAVLADESEKESTLS